MSNELIGVRIHGYCNGYFGRDDYNSKTLVSWGKFDSVISGGKRVYGNFSYDDGRITYCTFDTVNDFKDCLTKWSQEEDDDDQS